ncbi:MULTISPECIES: sensor histidine kinase [unclassified Luteococcus]|uniref:sensor histidine kinase n=1 Tax=unclassified Luteococcus TaxID=2639923 RepID=UPI00313DCDBC
MPLTQYLAEDPGVSKTSSSALRALGLTQLLLVLSTETLSFVIDGWSAAPGARFGLACLLLSQVLAGLALLLRREKMWHAWLLYALLAVGIGDALTHPGEYDVVGLMIPGFWLVPLVVVALRTHRRRKYLTFAGITTGSMLILMVLLTGFQSFTAMTGYLWLVLPVAQTLLFGEAIIQIAESRDAAVARQVRTELQHQQETAQIAARREAARLLHDHVLHALHALSRPPAGTPVELVRDECRTAYRTLTEQTPAGDVARVEDLLRADPLVAEAGAVLSGNSEPVPTAAAQAMAAAAHEALRNVQRHARATRVGIRVASLAGVVRMAIVDDGRGFDPARRAVDRMGVGRSILQRLDDVGGRAEITSQEGSGTRVTLEWPRQGDAADSSLWYHAPSRAMRRHLTRAAWPGLAFSAALSPFAATRSSHPTPLLLLSALGLALGCAAAVVLSRRQLRPLGVPLLLMSAWGLWAVNLWALPIPPEYDYPLWMAWLGSSLVHLVVLSSRLSVGAVVTALWAGFQAGGMWLRFQNPWAIWDHSFVLITGAGDVLLTLFVLAVTQHVAAQEAQAAEQASHRMAAIAQMQTQSQLDQFWSQRVTQEALPLLQSVGQGAIDPQEVIVRQTSTLLEAQLRDELVLGPRYPTLVAALARARGDGWKVVSTLSQDDSPESLQRAEEMVRLLGAPAEPDQAITISANQTHSLAVILDASEQQGNSWSRRLSARGGQLERDPDFFRLSLPVEPAEH